MPARSRIPPESRVVLRFLGAWSVLALAGFQARSLNSALDGALARLLGASLNLVHIPAKVVSTIVLFGSRNLRVADPCNGLQLLEILLALVWAWPASWRERARGLAWMLPLLFLANLVRLYSLVPLLIYRPDDFELIHQYVWQVVMVGVTLAIGVAWMTRKGSHAVDRPRA